MNTELEYKQCTKCDILRPLSDFGKNKSHKDGRQYTCKQCRRQYRIDNKDNIDRYRIDNKDNNRQYYRDNKDDIIEKSKQYYRDNKDRRKRYALQYNKLIALYDTWVHQLTVDEDPRLSDDGKSLEVKCKYCDKYFKPTNGQARQRASSIKGTSLGEMNLYCSDGCKRSCGVYRKQKYSNGYSPSTSREVQPELRKIVLKRDNWICQKCDNIDNNPLHCHHMTGVEINPIESADVDNCITLCKDCHKEVHKDCDMRRKRCKVKEIVDVSNV